MCRKARVFSVTFGTLVAALMAAHALAGQAPASNPSTTAPAKPWTPPKTPWGHPDLQGVWTSDAAWGIPLQRPDQFAGRAGLTAARHKQKVERDNRSRSAAENAVGSFRGDGAWLNKSFRQTCLIGEPAEGKIPPVTPEAEKRRAPRDQGSFGEGPFEDPEGFTLYDRCITRGVVGSIVPVNYANGNRILQTPNEVLIIYEMVHDTRIIPLDGRAHVGSNIRQYLGDARGRWEGNTLVIETVNLTDKTSIGLNGNGLRHSAAMKLVERFTRVEPDVIRYEVTIKARNTLHGPGRSLCRSRRLQGFNFSHMSVTRGTTCYRRFSAPSGPRTRRMKKTPKRESTEPEKGFRSN